MHKAVVLGSNYYIGLAVIRSLGRKGIPVITVDHGENNFYGRSRFASTALRSPHYQRDEQAYLDFLIDIAENEEKKPVLYPTADPYVEFIDRNFYKLKEHYLFPMDKQGLLTDLMDKGKLAEYADRYGVLTPEIIFPKEENFYRRVEKELTYPCIIKPSDSSSFVDKYRHKAFLIDNEEQLRDKLSMIKKDGLEVFVQRLVKGPETNNYNFDAYFNQEGKAIYYMTEQKIRQWPVNFGASTFVTQKWIPEARDLALPFLEAVGFKGFAEVEMKKDERNGKIYLIEVNVRYVNFTQLHVELGMDTPYLTYLDMTGQETGSMFLEKDTGVHWRYLYEDIFAMRRYKQIGQYTRQEIKKQNRADKIVASTWAWDDPWPGIRFVFSRIFNKIVRTITRR